MQGGPRAGSGVNESSGSPGSLLVASSRLQGLVPSRMAKAGEGPGCLAGKRTRTGVTVVRKSERTLGTWISSSATVYTPSGATNDKSFSTDPTKLSLAVERFLAGCAKRSEAESGVDESSGSPGSLLVALSRSRGLVPSRLAKAGEGPGCLAGKRTRTGAMAVRRAKDRWVCGSAPLPRCTPLLVRRTTSHFPWIPQNSYSGSDTDNG